ncbi:MAG TPA: septation protein IspZ [Xanthobacteraceae bacterium]|nr:septation protein IspZ [Xanthobacteraceae bacterium]
MSDVFRKLAADFLSTIIFLIVMFASGSVLLATGVAIAGAIGQFAYARFKDQRLDVMTWASLALVLVLGSATLMTNDPRFVLIKPSIAHFAIGAIMLRPGWMLRYSPPVVREHGADLAMIAGYSWAVLMIALGIGTVVVAWTGDLKLWAFYVSVVAVGAKIAAFAIQYVAFRIIIRRRILRGQTADAAALP